IHGGTKANIIPDRVTLQLTVRSFKDEVQQHLLAAIERMAKAEAAAGRAPREPTVTVSQDSVTHAMFNDPALSARLLGVFRNALGADGIGELPPRMGSEDFSEFGRAGIPAVQIWVGATEAGKLAELKARGQQAPGLHSALFAPEREPTIRAGTAAFTLAAL